RVTQSTVHIVLVPHGARLPVTPAYLWMGCCVAPDLVTRSDSHHKGRLAAFRMARQRAIGKTTAVRLVNDVHDAARRREQHPTPPDTQHGRKCHLPGAGARLEPWLRYRE